MTTLADLRQIAALASAAAPTPAVAPEATQPQPARTADGRFLPGHSGNPAGRPPRASDAGRLMLDRIAANAEALTAALIERACAGDRMALRLCVDRLLGPARSRPLHAPVEAPTDEAGLARALGQIIEAVAGGELSPAEAATLAGLVRSRSDAARFLDPEELDSSAAQEAP